MSTHTDLSVLEGKAYYEALLEAIPLAKKRIVLAAMLIWSDDQTDAIFEEIKKALQRGVRVRIMVDMFFTRLYMVHRTPGGRKGLMRTLAMLKELQSLGARVYYFGRLGLIPYRGRSHVKVTVVDDDAYSFGGVNLTSGSFAILDYMVHSHSSEYADCLEDLIKRIGTLRPPLENGEVQIDNSSAILFDGGKKHSSIIYEKACELSAQATKVHYVSQLVPSSKLAHLLHETDAKLFFNRPEQMPAPDSWGQAFDQQKYRLTNSYTGSNYIHAKFMLFELPGNRRALLTGSNNFSYRGVAFGTQEIALYSTDRQLWDQLYNFLQRRIDKKPTKK